MIIRTQESKLASIYNL